MGLFRRKQDPDQELANAIARRGVAARARIEAVRDTGGSVPGGVGRELELELSFATPERVPVRAVVTQRFNHLTALGLEDGEVAEIMYDREEPERVVVLGSPRYRAVDGGFVEVVDPAGNRSSPDS